MHDNLRKTIVFLRNSWITIWLIVIAVLCCATVTYASYMGVTSAKRVVSLSDRDSMLFSSRYLSVATSNSAKKVQRIGFAEKTTDPSVSVDICNYDKNGLGYYGKDIVYILKARLVRISGSELTGDPGKSELYRIENNETNDAIGLTHEWQTVGTYTLEGGSKNRDIFNVYFDKEDLDLPKYAVEIIAEVSDSYDDIASLAGLIAAVSRTSSSTAWRGEYADTEISADPAALDAYNYSIYGTGTGVFTLKYDHTILKLDEDDLEVFKGITGLSVKIKDGDATKTVDRTSVTEDGNYTTITFPVSTVVENAVSRYSVRFYRVDGKALPSYSTDYISHEYSPEVEE